MASDEGSNGKSPVVYNVDGQRFLVSERYDLKNQMGRGMYGTVCSAEDKQTNTQVAIKRIDNPFRMLETAKKLLREIRLLRHFRNFENIISLHDILMPTPGDDAIYVVTPLMHNDLLSFLAEQARLNDPTIFTPEHRRYFMYQLIRGLHFIHAAKVIHRDLKPANILVDPDCTVRIADFGLSRDDEHSLKSEYVVSRWYRAPEILMNWLRYGKSIDVWSLGCIFAELLQEQHKVLFPGKNYLCQLHLILDLIGTPEEEDYATIGSENAKQYLRGMAKTKPKDLRTVFPNVAQVDDDALDLLQKLLQFNPAKRPTAYECLFHPYLGDYAWIEGEPDEDDAPGEFDSSFEEHCNSIQNVREIVNLEIAELHPEYRQQKGVVCADYVKYETSVEGQGTADKCYEGSCENSTEIAPQSADLLEALADPEVDDEQLNNLINYALLGSERQLIVQVLEGVGGTASLATRDQRLAFRVELIRVFREHNLDVDERLTSEPTLPVGDVPMSGSSRMDED